MDINYPEKKMKVQERYISVLGKHFKKRDQVSVFRGAEGNFSYFLLFVIMSFPLFTINSNADLIERVVAIVNKEIILATELQQSVQRAANAGEHVTQEEMLNRLIDRKLILDESKKFKLGLDKYFRSYDEEEEIVNEYITKRIKSVIHVSIGEIEKYYKENSDKFMQKDLYAVWDEIDKVLREKKLGEKLDEHIEELRKKAYIRIQMSNKVD